MRYIPNGPEDVQEMLEVIGADSVERLFETIPSAVKLDRLLDLPGPWSEIEVRRWFDQLAAKNVAVHARPSFLGAGVYSHYQPAAIDQLLLRAEFLTAYTPYQPEVSQGTLQSIFEYQTHQCMLTELDVANASLYDGSTAFVEAVLLADRVAKNRRKVVVSRAVHPQYLETLRTYIQNLDIEIVEVGYGSDGRVDPDELRQACDDSVFAVAVQSPNFFGVIEDYDQIASVADSIKALKIAVVTEAISLGILTPPGRHRFEIAVGEGQSWGIPPQFGGPYVGFMVVRDDLKRHMPGRLVGETVDSEGRRGYVLTLATREQHIRRGKATSNICTNQALIALAANMYLSLFGRHGLREVAEQCLRKAHYLKQRLAELEGVELPFSGPTFNEFTVRTSWPAKELLRAMAAKNVLAGVAIHRYFPGQANDFLVAVTELNTREELDLFVKTLAGVLESDRA
jgi:glycine dehydrogenase subunit 1